MSQSEISVPRRQRRTHRTRRLAQQAMAGVGNNDLARRFRRKSEETRPDSAVTEIASSDDHRKRDRKRRQSKPHRGYRARAQTA